jgi:hypothetical protein
MDSLNRADTYDREDSIYNTAGGSLPRYANNQKDHQ